MYVVSHVFPSILFLLAFKLKKKNVEWKQEDLSEISQLHAENFALLVGVSRERR